MKFRVPTRLFYEMAERMHHALSASNQILTNMRIDARPGGVQLSATDLTLSLQGVVATPLVDEPGVWCAPGKSLIDVLRGGVAEETLFHCDGTLLKIRNGRSTVSLPVVSPEDYPIMPSFEAVQFTALNPAIAADFSRILYCAGKDAAQPHTAGVHVTKDYMVCLDGFRLAMMQSGLPVRESVLIPAQVLGKIMPYVKDSLDFVEGTKEVHFRIGQMIATIRQIEARYPDVSPMIPIFPHHEAHIPREEFIAAIRRVSLASGDTKTIRLDFKGPHTLLVSARDSNSEAVDELEVNVVGELTMFLNAAYLLQSVERCKEPTLVLELRNPKTPLVIREGSYLNVITPRLG